MQYLSGERSEKMIMLRPSLVHLYSVCPWKYYLINKEGHTEPTSLKKELGTLVHLTCQEYVMEKTYRIKCRSLREKNQAEGMIRQFKAMWGDRQAVAVEKEVELKFSGGLLTKGHIDIIKSDGPLEIKTSLYKIESADIKRNIQIPYYDLAYEMIYKKKGITEVFVLGKYPRIYKIDVSEKWRDEMIVKFYETFNAINSGQFQKQKSLHCRICGFKRTKYC